VSARIAVIGALVLAAALPAPAALAAHGTPQLPTTRPLDEDRLSQHELGANLFAANCASCHGSRGGGVKPSDRTNGVNNINGTGPSLKHVGAEAADFYLRTGYMPLGEARAQPQSQRPAFDEKEIRALTAYVASLGRGPAIPSPNPARGSIARGRVLFTEHCAGCHQVVAEGGVVTGAKVPPLNGATSREIAEAVRIGPYVMPEFSKKVISDPQLDDLIAYVHYAQNPDDAGGWAIDHLGPFPEGMVVWAVALFVLTGTCVAIGKRLKQS
jgi:ubiquinol-cytochrome c reductase cytochrome c subunit